MTPDEIIAHMAEILRANPSEFFDMSGDGPPRLKKLTEMSPKAFRAVRKLTVGPDGTITVELYDKLKVIEKLVRHFGLFNPREPDPESPRGEPRTPPGVQGHDAFVESWKHRLRRYGPELLEDVRRMIIYGR